MQSGSKAVFDAQYQLLLQHLTLKGLQPKTIDAYSRAMRRVRAFFAHQIDDLSAAQLTDYFIYSIIKRSPKSFAPRS